MLLDSFHDATKAVQRNAGGVRISVLFLQDDSLLPRSAYRSGFTQIAGLTKCEVVIDET